MPISEAPDQDADPPAPDGEQPDFVESDGDGDSGQGGSGEPASHPDPEPGADHSQAGTDS
jgi:hypothetical protein